MIIDIIGTGPVGLITERICQIRQWPYRIFGPRLKNLPTKKLLITETNLQFLADLGIKPTVQQSFSALKITKQNRFHHLHISAQDYDQNNLCCAIEYADLITCLLDHSNYTDTAITQVSISPNSQIRFTTNNPEKTYTSDLLVACDGSRSVSKKNDNFSSTSLPTQYAHLITLNVEGPTEYTLMQRVAQHQGTSVTLGVIPGSPGMIILTSATPIDSELGLEQIKSMVGYHYTLSNLGPQTKHSFTPELTASCYKNSTLLLGNAAMTISPVAAQGLNHAIHNLKTLHGISNVNQHSLQDLGNKMQISNQQLFKRMTQLSSPKRIHQLIVHSALSTQYFSPILQDIVWQFGNRYD